MSNDAFTHFTLGGLTLLQTLPEACTDPPMLSWHPQGTPTKKCQLPGGAADGNLG